MASRRGFCFIASPPRTAIATTWFSYLACVLLLAGPAYALDPTNVSTSTNEGRAMSVASTWTPRILDRQPFRLVPIVWIAAFSWRWAMAQIGVPGAQRIIHEIWTLEDGAPEAARAFAQTADGSRGDREGRPDSPPRHFPDIETQGGHARVRDLRFTHLTTNDGLSQKQC
jgi:hypothetical protein